MTDKLFKLLVRLRKAPVFGRLFYFILRLFHGVDIPRSVIIGSNVSFPHGSFGLVVNEGTIIEDNVRLYQGVTLGRADIHKSIKESNYKGILIKEGAIICAGAKVLCKENVLTVGKGTVIAANSVLLNSTGNYEIWAGIPAKKIGENK